MEEDLGSKPPHSTPKPSQQAVSSLHNNTHFVQVNRDSDGREYQGYTDGVTQPDLMSIGSDGYCPSLLTEQHPSVENYTHSKAGRKTKTAGRQQSWAGDEDGDFPRFQSLASTSSAPVAIPPRPSLSICPAAPTNPQTSPKEPLRVPRGFAIVT